MLRRRETEWTAALQLISLAECTEPSELIGHNKMYAGRTLRNVKSPRRMDHFSQSIKESPPQLVPDHMDRTQIRVSHSDAFMELSQNKGGISDDERLFRSSRMTGKQLQDMGCYYHALLHYRTALQCKNRTIDSEPQSVQEAFADILFDIGTIHLAPGFEDKAKSSEAFYFCLDRRRGCLGSNHPDVAGVLRKLASIHSSVGEHQNALDLLLEAVSIFLATSPGETTKINLIELWTAIGKVQEALGHAEEAQSSFQEAEQLK